MARPMQMVKVYGVQDRRSTVQAKLPWVVRYTIDGSHRSKSFRTRAEAERYRDPLLQAVHAGERFDVTTGEPESWQTPLRDVRVHDWSRRWLADQWQEWQPRTRASATEALARFITIAVEHDAKTSIGSGGRRDRRGRVATAIEDTRATKGRPHQTERRRPCVAEPGCDGAGDRRDRHAAARQQDIQSDDRGRVLRRLATIGGSDAPSPISRAAGRRLGRLEVTEADISFDEPGEPKTGPRSVPIPPVLVKMLREWVEENDLTSPERLLFRTRNDTMPSGSNWARAWHRALESVGQRPMRIYDCRHAAATTWLRAGMPLGETARRLGHSVETLVSTYVGALDDEEQVGNQRIDSILG